MTRCTELIAKFKRSLLVPNVDFTDSLKKDFVIELVHEHEDVIVNGGSEHFVRENAYFKVVVPDSLYDYLLNEHPDYDKTKKTFGNFVEKNFIKTLHFSSFKDLYDYFEKMTLDALFMKKLENLEENNKVIFIRNSFGYRGVADNYNHADMNKLVSLEFSYFVAYEVPKKKIFFDDKDEAQEKTSYEYFGLRRREHPMGTNTGRSRNQLPYLPESSTRGFTKIKWTKEREDFLAKIEERMAEISGSIKSFIDKFDDDNFELMMSNVKLLELKE